MCLCSQASLFFWEKLAGIVTLLHISGLTFGNVEKVALPLWAISFWCCALTWKQQRQKRNVKSTPLSKISSLDALALGFHFIWTKNSRPEEHKVDEHKGHIMNVCNSLYRKDCFLSHDHLLSPLISFRHVLSGHKRVTFSVDLRPTHSLCVPFKNVSCWFNTNHNSHLHHS